MNHLFAFKGLPGRYEYQGAVYIAQAPNPDHIILCENCGGGINLAICKMATGTIPNTLTNLPDHNTPHAVCPHCGYVD